MRIITDINHAADMLSASNWETYKDDWREELDIISGVQLVDGEVRTLTLLQSPGHTPVPSPDHTPSYTLTTPLPHTLTTHPYHTP
jgi:hypothetical protein